MWGTILRFTAVATSALAVAPPTFDAGGPGLVIGATEDAVRSTLLSVTKAQMDLLVGAGFRGVRITQIWSPGERNVSFEDETILRNVATAAQLDGVTVLTSVLNRGSRTTPLSDQDQADFAAYAASVAGISPELRILIVGNEPNLNRYWLPPVSGTHPNSTTIALADYTKLVASLSDAFDGTAQDGADLPIWYDEFGVESQIPEEKQALYSGVEPAATKPVDETTQAAYYRQAVQLAFCQPNVRGLFVFHAFDEQDLAGWQSGVYYADGTPKSSLNAVKLAFEESRRGIVASCEGVRLEVHPKVVQQGPVLKLTCDLDCSYVAQLYRLPGKLLTTKRGHAVGGKATTLPLRAPKARGSYRLRLSAVASVNPGRAALLRIAVQRG